MIWLYFLCAAPLAIHVFDDRDGDNRKINDLLALTAISIAMVLAYRWLGIEPYRTAAAILGFHFGFFDYLIVHFLRKNEVIRQDARWFSYIGKSAKTDKMWGRLKPAQRFAIRLAVFVAGTVIFWI